MGVSKTKLTPRNWWYDWF